MIGRVVFAKRMSDGYVRLVVETKTELVSVLVIDALQPRNGARVSVEQDEDGDWHVDDLNVSVR